MKTEKRQIRNHFHHVLNDTSSTWLHQREEEKIGNKNRGTHGKSTQNRSRIHKHTRTRRSESNRDSERKKNSMEECD